MTKQDLLRKLPQVDLVLKQQCLKDESVALCTPAARHVLDNLRSEILAETVCEVPPVEKIAAEVHKIVVKKMRPNLRHVVNATGVVLHTNMGRALMSKEAAKAAYDVAMHYSNLEFDVESGTRGSRYTHVEQLLQQLTGAEAALVVNNNAAAVMLILSEIAGGKQVVVSRGELVEIGGSFRVPDVMEHSGAKLCEVGTTNKTHLHDYEHAICEETAALMRVHTSNYKIVGFTQSVPLNELAQLGQKHGLVVIDDLGSGAVSDLSQLGISEPHISQSVQSGADIISFSGDKLFGGPQAGIIIGKKIYIERLKKSQLLRALRVDKMCLAALEVTLRQYIQEKDVHSVLPVLRMISEQPHELMLRAKALHKALSDMGIPCKIVNTQNEVGGGSAPAVYTPSYAVAVLPEKLSPNALEKALREGDTPVIGRINEGKYLLDVRTVAEHEVATIAGEMAKVGGLCL